MASNKASKQANKQTHKQKPCTWVRWVEGEKWSQEIVVSVIADLKKIFQGRPVRATIPYWSWLEGV